MISQLRKLYNDRVNVAKEWKEKGGKILGYFNSLTPEELIYAADILPVQILCENRKITKSTNYLPVFLCSFLKESLEQALTGELDYMDGIAMAHACESMRGFYGVWKKNANMPQSFFLQVPATGENDAKQYFMKELRLLKEFLEKLSGKAITNERLRHAIEVYNENRSLMKQLYELRKRPGFAMSGRNVIDIIRAGLVIPKDSHNDILTRLIEGYNDHTKHHDEGKALRLYILSNTLEETDSIIQLIEELGGEVIGDNFCFGLRYCWEPVILGSDPMVSLADHYLEKIPIPGKYPMNMIADQLTDMVKTSEADGAIYVVERFCDPYLFEYPILLESMKEKGIQILNVEAEEAGNPQRLRTKLEAFMEVLQSEIV